MASLDQYLKISRCPHCSVDKPNLKGLINPFATTSDNGNNRRTWQVYACGRCGGVVTACANGSGQVSESYPDVQTVDEILPVKVRTFLQQAIDSTFAPSGSVMLCASAVDAMLKEKNYLRGSLYSRINAAETGGLLTADMATWAHEVRLDANDNRHADENAELPTVQDAKHAIAFTQTLAEFLFVLPSRVRRGIEEIAN